MQDNIKLLCILGEQCTAEMHANADGDGSPAPISPLQYNVLPDEEHRRYCVGSQGSRTVPSQQYPDFSWYVDAATYLNNKRAFWEDMASTRSSMMSRNQNWSHVYIAYRQNWYNLIDRAVRWFRLRDIFLCPESCSGAKYPCRVLWGLRLFPLTILSLTSLPRITKNLTSECV